MSKDTVGNYSRGYYKNNRNGKIISLKRKLYKNRFKFEYIEEKYADVVVRLEVEEENERAVHVYKKAGYEVLPYMEMIRK